MKRIADRVDLAAMKTEDLTSVEEMKKRRKELGKFETREAMKKRITDSPWIPGPCKERLIQSLDEPFDPVYEALVKAYFNAIAGYTK